LGREESHAGFFFGEVVDVLGGFGIELESSEDEDFGFGVSVRASSQAISI